MWLNEWIKWSQAIALCNNYNVVWPFDDINDWNLKHSISPEGSGVRIDHHYRLLIKKENEPDPYLTSIYHFNDLKYHLKETCEIYDQIFFTQNVSLKIPPHDYFL